MITIKAQTNTKWNCRSPAPAGDFTDFATPYNHPNKGVKRLQGRAPTSNIV